MIRTIVAALFVATFAFAASAATFSVLCDSQFEKTMRGCSVKLTGQILAGDAERLKATLRRPLPEGWRYHTLLLDSNGGSIREALEIAAVVRVAVLDTSNNRLFEAARVKERSQWNCISACFLIWVAGAERSAVLRFAGQQDSIAGLGLHRPYLDKAAYAGAPDKVAAMQQQVTQLTTEYLQREQIPQSLIQKMLLHASTQVYWVTYDDEEISQRSPWFEEMMISRCGYDPNVVNAYNEWHNQFLADNLSRLKTGKMAKPFDQESTFKRYIAWRQQYNGCEYEARAAAQASFKK